MGMGNCQDLGEGRGGGGGGTGVSKSFRFDLFLLASGSTRAEMMKKVEVKRAGHRCSL